MQKTPLYGSFFKALQKISLQNGGLTLTIICQFYCFYVIKVTYYLKVLQRKRKNTYQHNKNCISFFKSERIGNVLADIVRYLIYNVQ